MSCLKNALFSIGLMAATLCMAEEQWGESLIPNGNFSQGSGVRAEGWNPGYFDEAIGSVEWIKTNDAMHPNALSMSFKGKPKGLIQADSKAFRLPADGPRRIQLVTRYRGAGIIQIRFYSVDEDGGLQLLKRPDGSGVKLEQMLDASNEWKESVSEWTLSKERLSQNLRANVAIMFWPSNSELQVSSIEFRLDKPVAPAVTPVPAADKQ